MNKRLRPSIILTLMLFSCFMGSIQAAPPEVEGAFYGHISYVDNQAKVIRQDGSERKAVVNLPVAPGDKVLTPLKGRCEIQFDNGTIIRLDKNTRLKVITFLAPSLTSKWRISTLQLEKGRIYVMSKIYKKEKFQVVTVNSAFDFLKNGVSTISVNPNGNVSVFIERGKTKVMYGPVIKKLKSEKLKSGHMYTITSDHRFITGKGKQDADFTVWNRYVNDKFKELHFGINKVPPKITRYNKALVYWAEKWSTTFGEWAYDEIFGYVWKPGDEIFAFSKRPFFHADYAVINGKMFLVPQQPWAWVPAHMGTWVWMKWGWTWVPGNAFHCSLVNWPYSKNAFYGNPTLGYWVNRIYGGYDLFYLYHTNGSAAWGEGYYIKYKKRKKRPDVKKAPKEIQKLVKKLKKTPLHLIKKKLASVNRPNPNVPVTALKPFLPVIKEPAGKTAQKTGKPVKHAVVVSKITPGLKKEQLGKTAKIANDKTGKNTIPGKVSGKITGKITAKVPVKKTPVQLKGFRDWNPDIRWAIRKGVTVKYSSKGNEMTCPTFKLKSRSMTKFQKASLRQGYFASFKYRASGDQGGTASNTAASKTAAGRTASTSRTAQGGHSSGGGGKSKKK